MLSVYFDLETDGVEIATAQIIQMAAVAVGPGFREIESFHRLVRFDEKKASPEALKVNHYDPTRWASEAIPCAQALAEFCAWSRPYQDVTKTSKAGKPYKVGTLAGYNAARFDFPILQRHCKAAGVFLPFDLRVRDAMLVSMSVCDFTGVTPRDFKLSTIADLFKVEIEKAHDALSDVRTTIGIMRRFSEFFEIGRAA